jgi:hypothetical protein
VAVRRILTVSVDDIVMREVSGVELVIYALVAGGLPLFIGIPVAISVLRDSGEIETAVCAE